MASRLVIGLLFGLPIASRIGICQSKISVGVMEFTDSQMKNRVEGNVDVRQNLGREASEMLATRLTETGIYSVFDIQTLEKVETEEGFGNSDRVELFQAARLGNILGIDAMILGEVKIVDELRTLIFPSLHMKNDSPKKLSVRITAKLVQSNSGEVLELVSGESTILSLRDLPVQEALKVAVNQITSNLNRHAPQVSHGYVVDVSDGKVILNVGSQQSLKIGDTIAVLHTTSTMRDPAIGTAIQSTESRVGLVEVTSVYPTSATGRFSGKGQVQVGDSLRWLSWPTSIEDSTKVPLGPANDHGDNNVSTHSSNSQSSETKPSVSPSSTPNPPKNSSSPINQNTTPPVERQGVTHKSPDAVHQTDEYVQGEQLEAWKKTLKEGAIEYRVPKEMTATVPATVTANLHGYQDVKSSSLPEATGKAPLKVSTYMKVELFAPMDPGEFMITQSSGQATQFIPNDGYATWIWNVTPAHAALSELLQIRVSLVHKDNTTAVEQILDEKTYYVDVNVEKLSVTIKQSFWKDPIAWFKYMLPGGAGWGAAAALFAWIGGFAWWKKRKAKRKSIRRRS